MCLKIAGWVANSTKPDQMLQNVSSDLVLFCLLWSNTQGLLQYHSVMCKCANWKENNVNPWSVALSWFISEYLWLYWAAFRSASFTLDPCSCWHSSLGTGIQGKMFAIILHCWMQPCLRGLDVLGRFSDIFLWGRQLLWLPVYLYTTSPSEKGSALKKGNNLLHQGANSFHLE